MSERRPPPKTSKHDDDGEDTDDASPTLEIVDGEADAKDADDEAAGDAMDDDDADVVHEPTSQGLGFDAIGFLAGAASGEPKRTPPRRYAETGQGLGFDPMAHLTDLGPPPSSPPSARAHDAIERSPSSRAPEQPRQTLPTRSASQRPQMRDRPALRRISTQDFGDVAGALAEAEAALASAPGDVEAQRLVASLREQLERAYAERLAPFERVVVSTERAPLEGLGHDAQFLASQVDGRSTIAQLLESSGMTKLDAMRVLTQLQERGVVAFR